MSVLIKGMKMPRYCAECDAVNDEEILCPFTNDDCENYFGVRNRNCPLSPVPPHGRLIDADAFLSTIRPICDADANAVCTFETVKRLMIEHISEAPTIIPAEEGQ